MREIVKILPLFLLFFGCQVQEEREATIDEMVHIDPETLGEGGPLAGDPIMSPQEELQ